MPCHRALTHGHPPSSLAGISKIFKDKKDSEDGVLAEEPGVDGKKPKKDKKRGLFGSKSNSSASKVTATTATGQDQAIPGLSPAAQLARQHTLRSKAEEKTRAPVQQTFEAGDAHSWDNDARSRPGDQEAVKLPPLGSAIPPDAFASSQRAHYRPDSPGDETAEGERDLYDSDEDAFDEEDATVDDVTLRMSDALQTRDVSFDDGARSSFEDQEYAAWGQWEPDRYAVPARGILKGRWQCVIHPACQLTPVMQPDRLSAAMPTYSHQLRRGHGLAPTPLTAPTRSPTSLDRWPSFPHRRMSISTASSRPAIGRLRTTTPFPLRLRPLIRLQANASRLQSDCTFLMPMPRTTRRHPRFPRCQAAASCSWRPAR